MNEAKQTVMYKPNFYQGSRCLDGNYHLGDRELPSLPLVDEIQALTKGGRGSEIGIS